MMAVASGSLKPGIISAHLERIGRRGPTGEVEEVAVLMELVEDGAGPVLYVGGGDDGDGALGQLLSQTGTAGGVFEGR